LVDAPLQFMTGSSSKIAASRLMWLAQAQLHSEIS
jgi:hypothetical protein